MPSDRETALEALNLLRRLAQKEQIDRREWLTSVPEYTLGTLIPLNQEASKPYLAGGWYEAEPKFRWAAFPMAEICFRFSSEPSGGLQVKLEAASHPPSARAEGPQRLRLHVNQSPLQWQNLSRRERLAWAIPPGCWDPAGVQLLSVESSSGYVPSKEQLGACDTRHLAFAAFSITVEASP